MELDIKERCRLAWDAARQTAAGVEFDGWWKFFEDSNLLPGDIPSNHIGGAEVRPECTCIHGPTDANPNCKWPNCRPSTQSQYIRPWREGDELIGNDPLSWAMAQVQVLQNVMGREINRVTQLIANIRAKRDSEGKGYCICDRKDQLIGPGERMRWVNADERLPADRDQVVCIRGDGGGEYFYEAADTDGILKAMTVAKNGSITYDIEWLEESPNL